MGNFRRKRPVTIEARQLVGGVTNWLDIYQWVESNTDGSFDPLSEEIPASGVSIDPSDGYLMIANSKGVERACRGDWIVWGVKDEFYPVRDDLFCAIYEPVEGDAA